MLQDYFNTKKNKFIELFLVLVQTNKRKHDQRCYSKGFVCNKFYPPQGNKTWEKPFSLLSQYNSNTSTTLPERLN